MDINKVMAFTNRGNRCITCGKPLQDADRTTCDEVCHQLKDADIKHSTNNKLAVKYGYCGVKFKPINYVGHYRNTKPKKFNHA